MSFTDDVMNCGAGDSSAASGNPLFMVQLRKPKNGDEVVVTWAENPENFRINLKENLEILKQMKHEMQRHVETQVEFPQKYI